MKKFIYTLVIALASAVAFTSCTEEEIKPEATLSNGGGGGLGGNP
jgi:hypothetical protein